MQVGFLLFRSLTGAGTILETLRKQKKLIVVVNETLMGNHQHEIADTMAEQNYLLKATPSSVLSVLRSLPTAHFEVYTLLVGM